MKYSRLEEIISREVVAARLNDPIERAAKKMNEHSISARSMVGGDQKVIGMVTGDGISRLIGICK